MQDKDTKLIYEAFKPAKGSPLDGMLDPSDLGLDPELNPLPDEEEDDLYSRQGPYTKYIYVVSGRDGVYGVYTEEKPAQVARKTVGGGTYITKVPVDKEPVEYDSLT